MAMLSLREAAELAGVSKSTMWRAITSGRISAPRDDDGNFSIDPAEVLRVYPAKGAETVSADQGRNGSAGHGAPEHDTTELRVRNAALEAEVRGLRDMAEELRRARDQWQQQAERATLALAKPEAPAAIPMPPPSTGEGGGRTLTIRFPSWFTRRTG